MSDGITSCDDDLRRYEYLCKFYKVKPKYHYGCSCNYEHMDELLKISENASKKTKTSKNRRKAK